MLSSYAILDNAGWSCLNQAYIWSKQQTFGKSVEIKSAKYSWDRMWSKWIKHIQIIQLQVVLSQSFQCLPTQESFDQNLTRKLGTFVWMRAFRGCSWHHELSWNILMPFFPWYPLILIWCHSKWCTVRVFCNWQLAWPCFNNRKTFPPPNSISWGSPLWPPGRRVNQSSGLLVNLEQNHDQYHDLFS